jgi:prepilin-type N-terminal cleavage/methylation domain-containing protein
MKKQLTGFTLIEIMIALFISSLLTLLLYQSFSQTQRTARNINALMDVTANMPIAYNQLEKDFLALFVPERVFKDMANKAQKKDTAVQAPTEKEQKTKEPFKDIFVCAIKEKNLERMSFISTHSLALYNTVVPHAVRILYRLVPWADNPTLFSLVRQETTTLDMSLAKFKEDRIREYDLIRGVKELRFEFLVPEKLQEEQVKETGKGQKKEQEKQPERPKKYSTLDRWEAEGDDGAKKTEFIIPAYINVKGIFVDPATEREYPFEWKFAVPVFDDVALRAKTAQSKKPNTTPTNSVPPGQPGKPGPIQPNDGRK